MLIFFRTIFIYFLVLIVTRAMGKREIGQMQPFEFVIALMIADLAATPMADLGIPLSYGVLPILGLLSIHISFSIINMKSIKLRQLICGKPAILINKGKIDEMVLKKENFTINELQERLRGKDIFNFGDVEFAILETSGQITVITKPEKKVVTLEDLNINAKYEGISYELVMDGVIMEENLNKIGKNYFWLQKNVRKFGYEPEEALIVTYGADGKIYSQRKENK